MWRPVNLYAQQVRRVAEEDGAALHRAELKFNAYSLIGGQMSGDSGRGRIPIPCCTPSRWGCWRSMPRGYARPTCIFRGTSPCIRGEASNWLADPHLAPLPLAY